MFAAPLPWDDSTVDIGNDGKNERGVSKEPFRPVVPQTGPGRMTNEVVAAKVSSVALDRNPRRST